MALFCLCILNCFIKNMAFDQSSLEDGFKHRSLVSPSSPVNNAGSNLSFLPSVGDVQKLWGSKCFRCCLRTVVLMNVSTMALAMIRQAVSILPESTILGWGLKVGSHFVDKNTNYDGDCYLWCQPFYQIVRLSNHNFAPNIFKTSVFIPLDSSWLQTFFFYSSFFNEVFPLDMVTKNPEKSATRTIHTASVETVAEGAAATVFLMNVLVTSRTGFYIRRGAEDIHWFPIRTGWYQVISLA